jgi:hypothetical protein
VQAAARMHELAFRLRVWIRAIFNGEYPNGRTKPLNRYSGLENRAHVLPHLQQAIENGPWILAAVSFWHPFFAVSAPASPIHVRRCEHPPA